MVDPKKQISISSKSWEMLFVTQTEVECIFKALQAEYAKSASLARHVRRKFQMSSKGVNSRRTFWGNWAKSQNVPRGTHDPTSFRVLWLQGPLNLHCIWIRAAAVHTPEAALIQIQCGFMSPAMPWIRTPLRWGWVLELKCGNVQICTEYWTIPN